MFNEAGKIMNLNALKKLHFIIEFRKVIKKKKLLKNT